MDRKTQIGVALSLILLGLNVLGATANSADAALESELRRNTQDLLDAIAPGDVPVWNRLLDAHAIYVDENDVVHSKAQMLAELTPLPKGLVGHLKIADFALVHQGEVAVVTHEDDEYLDYHGQVILSRFRNTDTWIHRRNGWRLLATQVLAVQKDPPAKKLSSSELCQYAGRYQLTEAIDGRLRCSDDGLVFEQTGRSDRHYQAELKDVFFESGAPRTRRIFERDQNGAITGFVDRREGRDILWKLQRDGS